MFRNKSKSKRGGDNSDELSSPISSPGPRAVVYSRDRPSHVSPQEFKATVPPVPNLKEEKKFVRAMEKQISQESSVRNIEKLLALRREAIGKSRDVYGVMRKQCAMQGQPELSNEWDDLDKRIVSVNEIVGAALLQWKTGKTEYQILYGDAVTGALSDEGLAEILEYEQVFDELMNLLNDRRSIQFLLAPLADAIRHDLLSLDPPNEHALGRAAYRSLIRHLTERERSMGFRTKLLVPMEILPAEIFLGLLGEGYVMDDFGAGIAHGELTHRLQWYAISRALESGWLSDTALPRDTAGIYQRMNQAPFASLRTGSGASTWGRVMDRGLPSMENSYGFPGTLNRDLLEAGFGSDCAFRIYVLQHMLQGDVDRAWPPRANGPDDETLARLHPIGLALIHQMKIRLESARFAGQRYDWSGSHPSEVSEMHSQQLLGEGYVMRDGCLWM